ncbi:helix-turn-helix domain-containing protein [Cytobacillus sp. FSL W8-0315]|uniref:helix-turn-helix domain-containing protein n=1 Tax=Cytobacillus TaxID=2675230 RepID=UPI0001F45417|nr:hypothetical protein HMPREF1013_05700 [Bacillus sp. 2_A_57_CT2]MDA6130812.1 helix-turn-helix domain-containing protein [Escherichia coli]
MQKESYQRHEGTHMPFNRLLKQARQGDKSAMESIIFLFDDEIQHLSSFLRIPREEAVQSLRTELIGLVKNA